MREVRGQPLLKQQFVAECQLAALNYANALHMLKAERSTGISKRPG